MRTSASQHRRFPLSHWFCLRPAAHDRRLVARGFTLIELLVVLAIITLLIAMLLPALRSAREVAQSTKCMVGMRQFGVVTMVYAQDHKGIIRGREYQWTRYLPRYLGHEWPSTRGMDQVRCPTNTFSADGWSQHLQAAVRYWVNMYDVPNASQRLFASDANSNNNGYVSTVLAAPPARPTNLMFIHQGSANLLIADGHVIALKEEVIPVYRDLVAYGGYRDPGYWRFWGEINDPQNRGYKQKWP